MIPARFDHDRVLHVILPGRGRAEKRGRKMGITVCASPGLRKSMIPPFHFSPLLISASNTSSSTRVSFPAFEVANHTFNELASLILTRKPTSSSRGCGREKSTLAVVSPWSTSEQIFTPRQSRSSSFLIVLAAPSRFKLLVSGGLIHTEAYGSSPLREYSSSNKTPPIQKPVGHVFGLSEGHSFLPIPTLM